MATKIEHPTGAPIKPQPSTELAQFGALPPVTFQTLDSQRAPYLSFPMKKSKSWDDYTRAYPDFREYEPLIVCADDDYIRCADSTNVFHAFFLTGQQFYTDLNENGVVLRARKDDPNQFPFTEHWETILIVPVKDPVSGVFDMYPVKATFRRAMVQAIRKCARQNELWENKDYKNEAQDWINKSAAHAKAAGISPSWMRQYYRIRVTVQIGQKSQRSYPETSSVCEPCSAEYANAMMLALKEIPEKGHEKNTFNKDYESVLRAFTGRVEEIKAAMGK